MQFQKAECKILLGDDHRKDVAYATSLRPCVHECEHNCPFQFLTQPCEDQKEAKSLIFDVSQHWEQRKVYLHKPRQFPVKGSQFLQALQQHTHLCHARTKDRANDLASVQYKVR